MGSNAEKQEDAQAAVQEVPSTDSPEHYPTGWKFGLLIISLCLGTLLVAIDNTILTVAIPKITSVFNSLDDVGWYGSAYLLSITALQPSFGTIYKYFDVKITYLVSMVVFEVGSIICAAAVNSPMFILGRAIAGVGAAGLFQGALCIVGYTVPKPKRPIYLSLVVSVFGLATCFGPVSGGAFTTKVSWRWCFWINVPIGVPVFFLVLFNLKLKELKNEDRSRAMKSKLAQMDWLGALVLIAAICCILLALQWGGTTLPWKHRTIIGLFIGFGLLSVLFALIQWRLQEKATVPLRFLRQRTLLMSAFYAFFIYASNYIDGYFLPFYFQAVQGASASESGVRFISLAVPEVFAIVVTGAIVTMIGHYVPFMILSVVIGSIGTGFLSTIDIGTSTVRWAAYMVLTGIGIGIGVQLPYTAVQGVASERDAPIANALVVFFSQLGGAVPIPIGQTVFVNGLSAEIDRRKLGIPASQVIHGGATNLENLGIEGSKMRDLRSCYAQAVTNTMYFALASLAFALPFALCMEWRRLDKAGPGDVVNAQLGEGEHEREALEVK